MEQSADLYNVLDLMQKSEVLGEKALRDKEELVQMDRIRNKNREALNALKRVPEKETVYLCVGNMFFKQRVPTATKLIQDDQKQVNEHIEKLRRQLKDNVQQIQEMEDKGEQFAKFNLNPLTRDEMKSFSVVMNSIKKLDLSQ